MTDITTDEGYFDAFQKATDMMATVQAKMTAKTPLLKEDRDLMFEGAQLMSKCMEYGHPLLKG